jgi:hypothetical protein
MTSQGGQASLPTTQIRQIATFTSALPTGELMDTNDKTANLIQIARQIG